MVTTKTVANHVIFCKDVDHEHNYKIRKENFWMLKITNTEAVRNFDSIMDKLNTSQNLY